MEIADHPLAAVGDMRVAAQAVGMDVVHAIDTVAAHADGGEAGHAIDVVVMGEIQTKIIFHSSPFPLYRKTKNLSGSYL